MDFMINNGSKGLWALEYSTIQKCFHLDTLHNILTKNINACLNDNNNDYQIVFVGTQQECDRFSKEIRKQKNETN